MSKESKRVKSFAVVVNGFTIRSTDPYKELEKEKKWEV